MKSKTLAAQLREIAVALQSPDARKRDFARCDLESLAENIDPENAGQSAPEDEPAHLAN